MKAMQFNKNETRKAKNTQKTSGKKASQLRWLKENKLFAILVIGLVLSALYAATSHTPLKKASVSEFHERQSEPQGERVKFIMVYTKECQKCEINSSFVILLNKNNIQFSAQKYEASSPDGKRFIEKLALKKLPIILVDGKSLSNNMIVKTDEELTVTIDGKEMEAISLKALLLALSKKHPKEVLYNSNKDFFVLSELSLDGKAHIDYLLDVNECAPKNPEQLARVDIFVDPYGEPYIKSTEALDFYRDYYKGRMEFNYHYLPIDASQKFPKDTRWENIENLAKYLVCADEQGFLMKAENAFYARYCALDDNNVLDSIERNKCRESSHFGKPILGDEAAEIAEQQLNYDEKQFAECLYNFPERKKRDSELASKLLVFRVPTIVVNCKYSSHASNIDKTLCKLNPNLEHCPFFGR